MTKSQLIERIARDQSHLVEQGYDSLWQTQTKIERRDGRYYLDGDRKEEKRHRNMPKLMSGEIRLRETEVAVKAVAR